MSVHKINRAAGAHPPLSIEQAALYLRVAERTVQRYRHDYGIGYVARDGRLYFTREELDEVATWQRSPREA